MKALKSLPAKEMTRTQIQAVALSYVVNYLSEDNEMREEVRTQCGLPDSDEGYDAVNEAIDDLVRRISAACKRSTP